MQKCLGGRFFHSNRLKDMYWSSTVSFAPTLKGWVDSKSKCNRFARCGPVFHEVEGPGRKEQFGRSFPAERFTDACIHFPGDIVQHFLSEEAEICALRKILTQ